jgi:ABC-type transport system involved in multi-copper enzyme maturation permease subunit
VPVYEQTYRNYEGGLRHQFRWWIVVEQEFRVLSRSRIFKFLVLLAGLHVIFRVLQVVGYDVIVQDPNHPMAPLLKQIEVIVVNGRMFFDFVRLQTPLMFITLLYAGSGMICNDIRNNLMEIYFSKPLRWYDYVLGKVLALVLLGLSLTALPVILVLLQHNLLLPSMQTLNDSLFWGGAAMGYSLVVVIPTALCILACSAVMPGQNYAAITVFMLLIANSTMAGLLAGALRDRNYLVLSFPLALDRLGQELFQETRLLFELRWEWPMLLVGSTCLLALVIIMWRARRAEVAA